jgi:hypothetical protein
MAPPSMVTQPAARAACNKPVAIGVEFR